MTDEPPDPVASRLARRLGTWDAVVIGLASMIGAGIFAAIGPAAAAAGGGLVIGLAAAAVVAYCNASSSAQLATLYPRSGGSYVYGRERLGSVWGFVAGWGFVTGKVASCAAMGLTFGAYAAPDHARSFGVAAVVVLTVVNVYSVRATARLAAATVAVVLTCLALAVSSMLAGDPSWGRVGPLTDGGVAGILQAGGFLFFAFAGYARLATLGEEVRDPARTIPRAIVVALLIALAVYAVVATAALLSVGPQALADSASPLATAVDAGAFDWGRAVVRIGATVASLGVLVSLLAGVARTSFSMADERDLPTWLAAVHPRSRTPHHAEIVVGLIVAGLVLVADLRDAIGFSSFAVLVYYGVTNAAAITLSKPERRSPRLIALVGLLGCAVLAFTLPWSSIAVASAVLVVGLVGRASYRRWRTPPRRP
jgi:APA family basic amino acid/polyamine antiporter